MKKIVFLCVAALAGACTPSADVGQHQPGTGTDAYGAQLVFTKKIVRMPLRPKVKAFNTAPANANLQYYGGHVIANIHPISVNWGANVNPTVVSYMPGFYATVVNSAHMDWLNEYDTNITAVGGQAGTNQHIGRGTGGGSITITPSVTGTTIDDTQIQTELSNQISSGALPAPDANTYYAINFPPGLTITQGGSSSCSAFCAYHGTLTRNGQSVFYGVLPDQSPGSPCAAGCGTHPNWIDNYTTSASHELIEATTDGEVGLATTNGPPLAWYDTNNGEIGDICAYVADGPITGSDGTVYTVQAEWSNKSKQCQVIGGVSALCGPSNCANGCCDGAGVCQTGNTTAACGTGGGTCAACTGTQTCTAGVCSGGTTTCNATSCPNGCCDASGTCQTGTSTSACGTGGAACAACSGNQTCSAGVCQGGTTCDASNCNGCCDASGTCQTGTSTSACGVGGAACAACSGSQSCNAGVCQGGSSSCSHPICQSGAALTAGCDPCAGKVCGSDPYCCDTLWDSVCVSEVGSICGQGC